MSNIAKYPEPNCKRLLSEFLRLIQIDSTSYNEAAIASQLSADLKAIGCTVYDDQSTAITGSDSGNLIATLPATPGQAGKLYFSAHMDSVQPGQGIKYQIEDGVIRSQGQTILAGDDKVGIAAALEMLRTLVESGLPHPEIVILLSVAEEDGLIGARAMDGEALGFAGEPCFVLDADGTPGGVIIGAPFHYEFSARFIGQAAHAGVSPESGISAIKMAAQAVAALPNGRLDEMTTINVGQIQGGSANNVVPDLCLVTGEMRCLESDRLDQLKEQVTNIIEESAQAAGGQVQLEFDKTFHGFKLSVDDPLVQLVLSTAKELGLPAQTFYTGGGSDANIFAGKGLNPVVLATGMTAVHSKAESLAIADMENLTRLVIALALSYQP